MHQLEPEQYINYYQFHLSAHIKNMNMPVLKKTTLITICKTVTACGNIEGSEFITNKQEQKNKNASLPVSGLTGNNRQERK